VAKESIKSLRDRAKKLLDQAKKEEEKALTELGKEAVEFLNGKIDQDTLKLKAIDFGILEQ